MQTKMGTIEYKTCNNSTFANYPVIAIFIQDFGGKKVINIWLAFRILGLEMNFDRF